MHVMVKVTLFGSLKKKKWRFLESKMIYPHSYQLPHTVDHAHHTVIPMLL